jgi:hypothetical protein
VILTRSLASPKVGSKEKEQVRLQWDKPGTTSVPGEPYERLYI